jgi:hypothetical protein
VCVCLCVCLFACACACACGLRLTMWFAYAVRQLGLLDAGLGFPAAPATAASGAIPGKGVGVGAERGAALPCASESCLCYTDVVAASVLPPLAKTPRLGLGGLRVPQGQGTEPARRARVPRRSGLPAQRTRVPRGRSLPAQRARVSLTNLPRPEAALHSHRPRNRPVHRLCCMRGF